MTTLFTLITHVLIIGGAILMAVFTFRMILGAPSEAERNVRLIALLAGFLSFIGARAVGLDVPTLIFQAIKYANPFSISVFDIVFPSIIGSLAAWLLLRGLRNKDDTHYPFRLMIMLSTFILMLFADVYAATFQQPEKGIDAHLLPNLSFTVGLCLYIIIKYRTDLDYGHDNDWRKEV